MESQSKSPETLPADADCASTRTPNQPLAVIGIGCRFPGGVLNPDDFWKLLAEGRDAVTEVPSDRWNSQSFYDSESGKPGKTQARWGGFLHGIDQFDPQFFGISPREAAGMDPQQRLLLETAWEAIEDAGQNLESLAGSRTAVFVGISNWDYAVLHVNFRDRGSIDTHSNTGGALSIAANRISYCLDLRGPSAAVDTACSSALVAVHLACRSIWEDGCPLALAGGVNALLLPDWYVGFSRMGMLSPTGRCRAFDARADGFVRSEGAGMILLKPLAQALTDGDRVYAVIRGTAVNQDGRTPGMTVPSEEAQEALLREACRNAGTSPSQIRYVEAHGTGTLVGDPIEARALGRVLSEGRPAGESCAVGSVKTNIGHLEAGAGIAGLIKAALVLYHRHIPANLHFTEPNPTIDFKQLRLRVPVRGEALPSGEGPALAGVNSFGFGGTNAHVVLEEPPVRAPRKEDQKPRLFPCLVPVSARSPEALRAAAGSLAQFVSESPDSVAVQDIAWNAAQRRSHHERRLTVVAHSKQELREALAAFAEGRSASGVCAGRTATTRPRIAFVCSGQGPQWWAMGRQLLQEEPIFREVIHQCDRVVRQLGPWSLLDELTADEANSRMHATAVSQPAIFAVQAALAALWRSWGVVPDAVIGHSVGEVAAAHLAGIFGLDDAVRIIYHRGRCMERASSRGRMLAAALSVEDARRLVTAHGDAISVAAVNAPTSVTLSGEAAALETIAEYLDRRQVFCRFLNVQYAFHSAQMDPVRSELLASLRDLQPASATLPFLSTVLGRPAKGSELGAEYWWRNVRQTVRFADAIEQLPELGCDVVLELSPHPVLSPAVVECCERQARSVTVLPSLRRGEPERATMLGSLGVLHTLGHPIAWAGVLEGPRPFLRLPLYPWQRERCWSESEESRITRLNAPVHPLLGLPLDTSFPAWETRLDLPLFPYLADHCVQQAAILPAAACVEIALAAGCELLRDRAGTLQIVDLQLEQPCFLSPERPLRLQTVCRADDGTIHVQTRPMSEEGEWTSHFRARLRLHPSETSTSTTSLDTLRNRCRKPVAHADCYRAFRQRGLDYGPRFQGIERGWRGDREGLAEIFLTDRLFADADYLFHPAILDACFQTALLAESDTEDAESSLYLPVSIESVHLHRRPEGRLWSHARLRTKTIHECAADVHVYDDNGRIVAEVCGLRSRRVPGERARELEALLHAYEWQRRPRRAEEQSQTPGRWLICADRGGVGKQLAARLQKAGDHCTVIFSPTTIERCADDVLRSAGNDGSGWKGMVHLWNLDAPSAEELTATALDDAHAAGLLSVVHLVQAWDRAGGAASRLFLVTRGAQSVGDQPEPISIAQSPVLGLGRVVVSECPALQCKLVDLDPADADVQELFEELWTTDDEDEVALRNGERYVHRYVPTAGTPTCSQQVGDGVSYRLVADHPGTLDGLTLRALRREKPGRGQVEIEVAAAGLNFSDVMKALAIYPGLPDGPLPLGAECSGRVVAVGEGVDELRVGDEVLAVAPFAFGSHVTTRAELVALKPARLSWEEAAGVPIAFLTAHYALNHLGRLSAGERVLIHSATGGVGLAALELARRAGAEVFATAGTPEKRALLAKLGVEHVLDSRSLAFADEVLKRTGGTGVDVVLNSLTGEGLIRSLEVLADYGRFLEIGKRDIYQNTRLGLQPFRKNLSFFAIDLDRMIRERPAVVGDMLRRLTLELADDTLQPPPCATFPISDYSAAFRHMQQGKHIGKVVLSMCDRPAVVAPADEALTFRADSSYLITGGLGGFGLAVAQWMVQRGARHLVLVGRRGLTPEARDAVAQLEKLGANVNVHAADVSHEDDVAAVFAELDRTGPPLRGVVHAAMVLEDALLQNLDESLLRRVLAPKVSGAWNLHRLTRERSLDFFVLFSSLSSVFGHAGQGNYAAANAFLDGLAWHRRAHGLPALAINWGYVGEVGYLAQRPQLGERLERQGVLSFTVREALALLDRALRRQVVQISVMRIDWSRWRGLGVTGRVSPRFAHLLTDTDREKTSRTGLDSLLAARSNERRELLGRLLRDKIARVLGTSPDRLEADRPLLQLGFDSLMGVELRNWVGSELRINLPIVEVMRCPGLSHLTELLANQLPQADAVSGGNATSRALEHRNGSTNAYSSVHVNGSTSGMDEPPSLFPLSQGQRGLWLLHQLDRTGYAHNLSFASRIRSRLNREAFRQALQALVDRHPALRTTFEERDGQLYQRVHPRFAVPLEVVDVADWSEEALRIRLDDEAHQPFNLTTGPLLRLFLFARSPDDHVILMTAHHLVGDYWSLVVVLDELRALYPAACNGVLPELPPPGGHYSEFVRWQTDLLASDQGERLGSYWRDQLAGLTPVLELPTDRPRPARMTNRGAAVPVLLSPELTGRLKELAARERITLFTILLSAFQVFLGRSSGQDDLVVGSPFVGRSRPEFEGVVGYFINVLPLRANLAGNPTFRELLHRAGLLLLDALQHQDYPFPLLVERLNLKRDPSRTPLIQATFTLEKAHRTSEAGTWSFSVHPGEIRRDVAGLEMVPYPLERRICLADVEMILEEDRESVEGVLHYSTDLFDVATARRMVEHYRTLLEGIAADPERRLSELPWMTEAERRLMLIEWNQTDTDFPRDRCLHQLFEEQVARTPDAVAIRFEEQTICYAELDAWANDLARQLHGCGAGQGARIALCLERSPEMIAALLAVLKVGAAFVPLDPASPVERLRVLLDDVRPHALITHRDLTDRLPTTATRKILLLARSASEGRPSLALRASDTEDCAVTPSDLAYILYTSGSAGRPRGVLVEHRAICNTVLWQRQALDLGPSDRVLLNLPYFFDASLSVIFPALTAGAELVLAAPGEERDPQTLLDRVQRDGVTILTLLPRMLALLLDGPMREKHALRWICCGGEVMSSDLPARVFALGDVGLCNCYGPTETAVTATAWICQPGDSHSAVPIGRPIANVRAYVLNSSGQPAPIGVPGELYLGGAGLARGYLNDPETTAERFVPNPFDDSPGARLYRTGDRCRWRADGVLEFLDRLDGQLKVSGHRIEPAEIEAALTQHPGVREAVVATQPDGAGGSRLAAYLVTNPEEEDTVNSVALQRYLRDRLPEYMIPSAFVFLPALPRTATGKLDRNALPTPRIARQLTAPWIAPRTPLEEFLVRLWGDSVGVDRVGVEDNFFDLGGSSLQAAGLVQRVRERLGCTVSTVALFDAPTVTGFSRRLVEVCGLEVERVFGSESMSAAANVRPRSGTVAELIVPLQPNGSETPWFLVHPPGGIVVCYRSLARRLGPDQPVYGIRARGLYGETDVPDRLEDMAAEYVAALRSVQPEGPYRLGGWSLGGVFALEMAQQLLAEGQCVECLAFFDTTLPPGSAEESDQRGEEYGLDLSLEELEQLGPDEQLPYLWQHVEKLGLVDPDTPSSLVQQLLDDLKRLFHDHVRLASRYAIRPYPGRVTLFRPTESLGVISPSADRGWSQWADEVEVRWVPGLHHTMVQEPHVEELAREIQRAVSDASQKRSSSATLLRSVANP